MFRMMPMRRRRMWSLDDFVRDFWNWPMDGGFDVDIQEQGNQYVFQAELPGLDKERIRVEVDGEDLVIGVNNSEIVEEKAQNYLRKERRLFNAERRFYIGQVNPEEIQAKYVNGILEVRVPKTGREKLSRRSIPIR